MRQTLFCKKEPKALPMDIWMLKRLAKGRQFAFKVVTTERVVSR